jgi:hypothetical protein
MEFEVFQTIERVYREAIQDHERFIASLHEHLLHGSTAQLPHIASLRKNWYFVELAVLSAAKEPQAPSGSLPYRVFAEYARRFRCQHPGDSVLAEGKRLVLSGE